jgi:integrase
VYVPEELREFIGKREIWKSLGTVSHREAVRQAYIESVKIDALFAEARLKRAGVDTGPTDVAPTAVSDEDLQQLARSYLYNLEREAAQVPFSQEERDARRNAAEDEAAAIAQSDEDAGLQLMAQAAAQARMLQLNDGRDILRATEALRRALLEHYARDVDRAELRKERVRDPLFAGITSDGPAPASKVKVTFDAIIDAQVAKRSAGEGAKAMPAKSIQKYRRVAKAFSDFRRGADDATTVRVEEVEDWRDAMLAAGEPSNRTIADRLVCLGTIINWGKAQKAHRDAMRSAATLDGVVEAPSYVEKPADTTSYTMEEARKLLAATRILAGTEKNVHNRDAKRWLPWICVYGGLRISEAERLRKNDFFEAEGSWFFRITTAGKRSLKTRSSERVVPVHPAVVDEGFLDWLQAAPEGQLFGSSASSYMGRWVRSDDVGIKRVGISPNHGLRHLLKALAQRYQVSDEAREYILGHASADVHRKYGATDVMLPGLAAEMRKIVPLEVT